MVVSGRRFAIVADPDTAALHGLDGTFEWGTARTFEPQERAPLTDWGPDTVVGIVTPPPDGPWRTIAWDHSSGGASRPRRVGSSGTGLWRRAPLPATDALADLRDEKGVGVLVVGGEEADRESAEKKLRARAVPVRVAQRLTRSELASVAVVAMLGEPGDPLPPAAPAVIAAGRLLVAPRAEPAFGLLPWIDHLPYDYVDDLARSADAAQSFPEAFEAIAAMGVVAAEAHLASAVYGRLAIDAELEDQALDSAAPSAAS
jgi:hypothetical protein